MLFSVFQLYIYFFFLLGERWWLEDTAILARRQERGTCWGMALLFLLRAVSGVEWEGLLLSGFLMLFLAGPSAAQRRSEELQSEKFHDCLFSFLLWYRCSPSLQRGRLKGGLWEVSYSSCSLGNKDLGNVFLVSGTVGGAVYYTLKNSLKNEKFKNVSENQFSCSLNECNVLASPIC